MKSDQPRLLLRREMAFDCLPHIRAELVEGLSFSKYVSADAASDEPAFGSFFNDKQ
jgi:hypothetical protein